MKTIEQYDDWVERYRSGDLMGDDLIDFENSLESDPTLRRVLKLHEEIDEALKDEQANALRETLKSSYEKFRANETRRVKLIRNLTRAAAVVIVLIGLGLVIYFVTRPNYTNQELYDLCYVTYEVPTGYRSESGPDASDFNDAINLYNSKNYESSLVAFKTLIDTDSLSSPACFFAGLSLIELHRYEEAKEYLNTVVDDNDIYFSQQSEWYLALTYLKLNDIQGTTTILEDISGSDHYKKAEASELLKKLHKID